MPERENPEALTVLWASLECTNFSKAKGGQPRDADSRTLAEHLFRYIEAIDPDYIQIENVEEFMSWGEVDENGKADFLTFPRFLKQLIRSAQIYLDTHPWVNAVEEFDNNAYNMLLHNLFFDSYEKYHNAVTGGMFPETAIDAKAFLEDYFNIDLTL